MESVHGHEVMKMMIGKKWNKEELVKAIREKFGDAKFHTCSAEGMDANEIVDFLDNRGKFTHSDEGFETDKEKICNHE